ncbi:Hemin uptake protein hemP [Methylophilaceae bacterium 11]|jgi:hemin uptake protein HemP|uniref:hemin uptake protein HemP n=1 Tax=Methylotenera sp. N17 TaxID=1502761 RepID=UPI000447DCB9|nr:Hemin uptake protein hemP [Methylophilaceae bacterium 11]
MKIITSIASKALLDMDIAMVTDADGCSNPIKITSIKKLNSEKLFCDGNEVMIQHQNETYVLRLTKQNKLILTK